jgi:Fur family transcriptional regulator, ferric uptake regulator
MICTECGEITEFVDDEIEKRQHDIAEKFGFKMKDHSMQIYGLCKSCQK